MIVALFISKFLAYFLSKTYLAFFLQNTDGIFDILSRFNTPLSVAIVLWFCKTIFSAWREDTRKAREESQVFFSTLKKLLVNLENERKSELSDMAKAFNNLAGSIQESKKEDNTP